MIEIPQATGAIPRPEPMSTSGNRDYWIGKQKYEVWRDIKHYEAREGNGQLARPESDGNKTANGDAEPTAPVQRRPPQPAAAELCGSPT